MSAKCVGFRELRYFKWWVTKIEWRVMSNEKKKKTKYPLARFLMELEIVPCKRFLRRLSNSRWLKLYNQLGIEELKLLAERSRCLREVMFCKPIGIGPWKPLADRLRATKFW